jgi:plastocyanin
MKKIYKNLILLFTVCMFASSSFATIHTITVMSSSFSPATLNVNVNDTIIWVLGSGSHTTTSTTIPAGAMPWDSPINSSTPAFGYEVTVAGTYNYKCTPHGFTGQFIATGTSGITAPIPVTDFNIYSTGSSAYTVSYNVMHSSNVQISLYDLTGKAVRKLSSSPKAAGEYKEVYYLDDLRKGIYLVEFIATGQRITKRIIIE